MRPTPRAMILAAGLGTRLGPVTSLRPKPMLPLCGRPIIRWIVLWLRSQGIREIVVNLHHLGEQIEAELGDGREFGVSIAYSREAPEVLGTGGGVRKARHLLDDGKGTPIVLVNGKILLDLDLGAVLEQHRASEAEATMVLRRASQRENFGLLRLNDRREVVALLEHTRPGEVLGDPFMFTGVQVVEPRFLDRIPAQGAPCIVRTANRELFESGRGFYGFVSDGYWWEHSTIDRYLGSLRNILDGRAELRYGPRPLRGIDPSARIHPSAKIRQPVWIGRDVDVGEGAQIGPYVELGDDVVVDAGVSMRDVIAWKGAHISASCERAVAAGEQLLRDPEVAV